MGKLEQRVRSGRAHLATGWLIDRPDRRPDRDVTDDRLTATFTDAIRRGGLGLRLDRIEPTGG